MAHPTQAAREQYQKGWDLPALVAAVARVYAAYPGYAHLASAIAGQTRRSTAAEANTDELKLKC
jgi:hypothetical protein